MCAFTNNYELEITMQHGKRRTPNAKRRTPNGYR
jgi:hypothetical protein